MPKRYLDDLSARRSVLESDTTNGRSIHDVLYSHRNVFEAKALANQRIDETPGGQRQEPLVNAVNEIRATILIQTPVKAHH
jgi:hypothetical protein